MGFYADTISYAGQSIKVTNIVPKHVQAQYLQKIGKSLSKVPVPTDTLMWRIVITGKLLGNSTTLETARDALQTAHDDKILHPYVDGQHDGNYVCDDLTWNDSGAAASMKTNADFTMVLLEKVFAGGY